MSFLVCNHPPEEEKVCCSSLIVTVLSFYVMGGSRRGQRVRTPLEKSQNIGFLSNTGPDPKPVFNVGPSSAWRFAGGPKMARL